MKRDIVGVLFLLALTFNIQFIIGENYYVATNGSDSNSGTKDKPFATWQKGINTANQPGDTLFIRGGLYYSIKPLTIDPDHYQDPRGGIGTYENPIVIMSY